jgi:hypothetical protein
MPLKNLWGDLPRDDGPKPPAAILKEQASILGDVTHGILYGDVGVSREDELFDLELVIVAPALDSYRYSVLHVEHKLSMYPLSVVPSWEADRPSRIRCRTEKEFETALETVLTSDRLQRVIATLIAQSKAV